MSYVDVSPMMIALRASPDEFTFKGGWLHHIPSRHGFQFDSGGAVRLRADCRCAMLAIRPEQERELASRFREWQTNYWNPLEINREFASHFRRRSPLRRFLIKLTSHLHDWLLFGPHKHAPSADMVAGE